MAVKVTLAGPFLKGQRWGREQCLLPCITMSGRQYSRAGLQLQQESLFLKSSCRETICFWVPSSLPSRLTLAWSSYSSSLYCDPSRPSNRVEIERELPPLDLFCGVTFCLLRGVFFPFFYSKNRHFGLTLHTSTSRSNKVQIANGQNERTELVKTNTKRCYLL